MTSVITTKFPRRCTLPAPKLKINKTIKFTIKFKFDVFRHDFSSYFQFPLKISTECYKGWNLMNNVK